MLRLLDDQPDAKFYDVDDIAPTGDVCLKTGPFGSRLKTSFFEESGTPVITIGSISEELLNSREFFYLSESRASEFDEYSCQEGDIVFSRVADVGRCYLITDREAGYIISSNLIRIRVNGNVILPKYLWLLLRYSVALKKQMAQLTTQAAGRLLVNTRTLSLLRFAAPPVAQQEEVVSKFEKFSETKKEILARRSAVNALARVVQAQAFGAQR
jgi:type I restriction enzyme S subunit